MPTSAGQHLLRLVGGLCAAAGFCAWIGLAWKAFADSEGITAHGDEGGRLMVWALTGTVLMILGTVFLHLADDRGTRDDPPSRR
jgi:hypothetical protein